MLRSSRNRSRYRGWESKNFAAAQHQAYSSLLSCLRLSIAITSGSESGRPASTASCTNLIRPDIGTSRRSRGMMLSVSSPVLRPAVRSKQLGHPFAVPPRSATAEKLRHEGVRSFVQQQVPSIVICRLIEEPYIGTVCVAMHQSFSAGIKPSASNFSRSPIKNPRTCQSAVVFAWIDAEIPGPKRHGLVEQLRKRIDRRPAGRSV